MSKILTLMKRSGLYGHKVIYNNSIANEAAFTRASPATCFVDGLLTSFPANTPRFGTLVGSNYKGFIFEGARTNLCINSEDLSLWSGDGNPNFTNRTVSSTTDTAFATVWIMNEGVATGVHALGCYAPSDTGTEYRTYSVYLKAATATKVRLTIKGSYLDINDLGVNVDLNAGTASLISFGSASNLNIVNAGSGWYRVSWTVSHTGSTGFRYLCVQMVDDSYTLSYTGTGRTIKIAKPQIEVGTFASSYIPTTTLTATRAADICSIINLSNYPWFNAVEGTILCEWQTPQAVVGFNRPYWLGDNTATQNAVFISSQFGTVQFIVAVGGASQCILVPGSVPWAANTPLKLAGAYKANDFAASVNGSAVSTDTSGSVPGAAVDRLVIGASGVGGDNLYGIIKSLTYYPKRLPNPTLPILKA